MSRTPTKGVRKYACTFAVHLPADVGPAYILLLAARSLQESTSNSMTSRSCRVLAEKLTKSLGLPAWVWPKEEHGFMEAINDKPGDLSNWHVYADWLQERAGPQDGERSFVIRAWLHSRKAAKVKYGVIQLSEYP